MPVSLRAASFTARLDAVRITHCILPICYQSAGAGSQQGANRGGMSVYIRLLKRNCSKYKPDCQGFAGNRKTLAWRLAFVRPPPDQRDGLVPSSSANCSASRRLTRTAWLTGALQMKPGVQLGRRVEITLFSTTACSCRCEVMAGNPFPAASDRYSCVVPMAVVEADTSMTRPTSVLEPVCSDPYILPMTPPQNLPGNRPPECKSGQGHIEIQGSGRPKERFIFKALRDSHFP